MRTTAHGIIRHHRLANHKNAGFTLVELLVVIAILVILAIVVGILINPIEISKQSRDSVRLSDLANLQQAINIAAQEATSSGTDILCKPPATAPCTESTYPLISTTRKPDGTGWVKVDLSAQKSVSFPVLPVDPVNNATYNYTYMSDGNGWEIDAALESDKYKGKSAQDGGNDDNQYESGSSLIII